jgi:excisionase family DNA binding protein
MVIEQIAQPDAKTDGASPAAPSECKAAAAARRRAPQERQPEQPARDIVTTAEVAELLCKSRGTVENWRRAGILPYIQAGRSILFSRTSVLEALRRLERKAGQ